MLKGLGAAKASAAVAKFESQIVSRLQQDIYFLVRACYRNQDENAENRNESYNKIMSNLETRFKDLLKWYRYKVFPCRMRNAFTV